MKKNLMRGMGNFLAAASLGALTMHSALAGPTGENIVGGSAVITRPDVSTTVIDQSSQRVVIEWGSFNVGATERVEFVQPDASAAALNRILDQNPSQILGSIEANGRVLLINPNGIIFGSNAWVNVGSLIASSLDLDNDAFLNTDNWVFGNAGGATGGLVLNQGLLEAASDISLFGGAVENTGSIVVAELGRVNLAAGSQVTVDFDGDGLLQFAVSGAVAENLDARAAAVANSGSISAPGGQVLLSAEVANDVFAQVVNNQGVIAAGDVVTENGRVFLVGVGGDVVNGGEITASELGMEASGSIASNAAIEAGALELIAGEGISIGAADISVTGNAGFTAGGDVRLDGHISAFRIDVSSGGSIEGSGLLSSGVLRLAAGEGIGAAGNAMNIAAEELVLSAGNGAYLQEADDIILAGIDVASGNFSLVAAGDILQSGSINVLAGATRLEANDITANDADNVFGDSLSLTGRNVAVTSSGALTFGDSDISGTLTVTANGDISDAGMMQVLGNATFDAGGNAITLDGADGTGSDFNAVGVVSASNVSIVDVNGVTLGHAGSGINAATLTVNAASAHVAGAVTLAGALDLDVAGDFVSDGTIAAGSVDVLAGGSTTINADIASTGAIRLQSGTDLAVASRVEAQDSVSLVAAGAISLANANIEAYGAGNDVEISGASIDLAGARVTAGEGSISLQAHAGGIDDSQGEGLLAANQLSLDSAAGIGETNFINTNVTSVNAVAADGIRISEANALSVNASAGGDVELRTLNGSMTIGALETTAGDVTINVNGAGNGVTIHSLDAGDGELRVTTASGSISGPGNISAGTAVLDAASIILGNDPASVINFGSIDVRGGSVEINEDSAMHITRLVADSAILRAQGDITDAADAQITVSGSAVFEADGGDIILGDSAIDQFDVGTLGLRGGNAMVIADGAVNLDGVDVVTLAVQADGDVTDSGAVVATDANLRATGDIVLDHAANDFGRVEASAGGVIVLNDINSVTLDGLAAVNGIAVTAGGDIDAADLLVSGGLDDNDVVLEAGGAMTLAGIVAGGAGDVRLEAAGSIISTGNGVRADRLDIDAGGGVDLVTDVAALQAISRGAGDIVIAESNDILLDGVVNEAGAVEVTAAGAVTAAGVRATGGDITMDAVDALVLAAGTTMESDGKVSLQGATLDMQGTVIATGNVEAIASLGNLGMSGDISASGIFLQSAADLAVSGVLDALASVTLDAGGNATFAPTAAITTAGADTDDINITAAAIDLAGASLDAGVAGDISLHATAGGIDDSVGSAMLRADTLLLESAADIGATHAINTGINSLQASAAGSMAISETDALTIAGMTAAGDVALHAGGDLSIESLTTTAGNVTLGSGGAVSIATLDAGSGSLSITSNGSISDQAGSFINAGATFLDGGTQDIALGDDALDEVNFGSLDVRGGNVSISEDSTMNIERLVATSATMRAAGGVNLADANVADLAVHADGDITDSGAVVAADASLQASGDVVLDHAANDFGRVEASAGGVIVLNDSNSVSLDGLAAVNGIAVTAGGDIDAADLRVSGGLDDNDVVLDAGGAMTLAGIEASGAGDVQLVSGGAIDGTGIVADALSITAGGAVTASTDVNRLDLVTTAAGSASIVDADDLVLNATLANGALDVSAGGALDAVLLRSLTDADANDMRLRAVDITVGEIDAGTRGDVRLESAGSIVSTGSGVRADRLELDAGGEINLVTNVAILQAISRGAGDIVIAESDNILLDGVVNEAGAVEVVANGAVDAANVQASGGDIMIQGASIDAGQIDAGSGDVLLTATSGAIDDADGDALIRAATLELNAVSGIGNDNALSTGIDTLVASTGSGTVAIAEADDLLIAAIDAGSGSVEISAMGDIITGLIGAGGDVLLDALGRLEVNDEIHAGGVAHLDAGNRIAVNAAIDAGSGAVFGASRPGGVDLAAAVTSGGDLVFHGDVAVLDDLAISAAGLAEFRGALQGAGSSLVIDSGNARFNDIDLGALTVNTGDAVFDGNVQITNAFALANTGTAALNHGATAGSFTQSGGTLELGGDIQAATSVDIGGQLRLNAAAAITAANAVRLRGGIAGQGNDLVIEASQARLDAAAGMLGYLQFINGTDADINSDVTAARMNFTGDVDLAGGADLVATNGGIAIAGDLVLSGGDGSTSRLQSAADAAITLADVIGVGAHALIVRSEGDVLLRTASLAGDLALEADIDADQAGRVIRADRLEARDITLRGGSDRNDRIDVPVIEAGGNVVIENRPELATATRLTGVDIALVHGLDSTAGADLEVQNSGLFSIDGALMLNGALLQTGTGDVRINADVVTDGRDIRLAGDVESNGNRRISTGTSASGDLVFSGAIAANGDLRLDAGAASLVVGDAVVAGELALGSTGVLTLRGLLDADAIDASSVSGAVIVDGDAALHANSDIDLGNARGIDAAVSGGSLGITTEGTVRLATAGGQKALDALDVNGALIQLADVATLGGQHYQGLLHAAGDLHAGGNLRVDGAMRLVEDVSLHAAAIDITGGIDGLKVLRLDASRVNVGGDIGAADLLASLVIDAGEISLRDVATSGAQEYTGNVTLNGDMSASALRFNGALALPAGGALVADTIRFDGGARSVTGGGVLSIAPRSSGRTITLGEGSGLVLDAAALDGYSGGLVIGGFATGIFDDEPLALQPLAGDIIINAGVDVGEGWVTLLGNGDIVINSGVISGEGIALVTGGKNAEIINTGDGVLAGGDIILVAGGDIGAERDIRVSGDVLYVSSGAGTAGVSGQITRARRPVLAEQIAAALGINFNPNLQVASSEQRSASREQGGGIEEEGFIDPSLFEEIALYEIRGSGIALPADQSEEEPLPSQAECDLDDRDCGVFPVTSPR